MSVRVYAYVFESVCMGMSGYFICVCLCVRARTFPFFPFNKVQRKNSGRWVGGGGT